MSFDWAPFATSGHPFVKWENVGDSVVGTITAIRSHTFDQAKGPVVLLDVQVKDSDDLVTISADKVDLRRKLAEIAPQVGDLLAVRFTGTEKVPGSPNPMKVFEVKHKAGEREEAPPEYSDDPF